MRKWIVAEPNPAEPHVLPNIRLFGILGTWMEADVVAATIRNALTQGCERIYLVDNASPDDTVKIALAEGAILARAFKTERYEEALRLRYMNDVVREVSESHGDAHIWWLYLDADEFPHGPSGITLLDYVRTLDEQFRVVGMRFFDHYPNGRTYKSGYHPLDFQPLCEELAYPMCPSRHRKHSLVRYDRGGAAIECGSGFHVVKCDEQLREPSQPAFLHHFPYRDEAVTRRRLELAWAENDRGVPRAFASHDTHMLTRFRSLDAVYRQDWAAVHNFIALSPLYKRLDPQPPPVGVSLKPWTELVEPEHQNVLRWYSPVGAWKYGRSKPFSYGDNVSYEKGMAFLDGHGTVEDWGCGHTHAKQFLTKSRYFGIDGSSPLADKVVDLGRYTSQVDCIFMRHVLEHNADWRRILANAVASFTRRMALILFTPFSDTTRVIRTSAGITSVPVPDIAFRKDDLTRYFAHLRYTEEALETNTLHGVEHIFYIEK